MPTVSKTRRSLLATLPILLLTAVGMLTMSGCKSERMEIKDSRKRFTAEKDPVFGATAKERFLANAPAMEQELADAGQSPQQGSPKNPFRWQTPDGWSEMEASRMRVINLSFGPEGEGEGECYVTAMPGDAGGISANLNRWQGQMGQAPLSNDDIAALPKKIMFGQPATFIDIRGDFGGMTIPGAPAAETKSNYRMLGLVLQQPAGGGEDRIVFTFFVKMLGPEALVTANEAAFDAFCQSISIGAH